MMQRTRFINEISLAAWKRLFAFLSITAFLFLIGCREPYNPPIISSSDSYLVVEGVLNAGQGGTSVRLSRTYKLDDSARLRGEANAQVIVEGKDNSTRSLAMTGDGIYTSPGLNLAVNQEYRLRIITANGKEYVSDYIVAKDTPPIDSIGFDQNEKGVQFHVSTHDDGNDTRYYLWDFDETWEIRTVYFSRYKFFNGAVVERDAGDDVSTCWKYDKSSSILVGSSAALQSDIVRKAPLFFINNGDEKLSVRYSMLVRQYALDKRGYDFYELMRKNTESLGTLFDAQPSESRGNITCLSDPSELVVGYISSSVMQEKRFFVAKSELPLGWRFLQDCNLERVKNDSDSVAKAVGIGWGFVDEIRSGQSIVAWNMSRLRCLDCTRRGGSLIKPSYW